MLLPSPGIPLLAPGGASEHFRALAEGFVAGGLECRAYARRLSRGGGVPDEPPPQGVPYAQAPRGRLPGFLRKRRVWDERVDAAAMARWLRREFTAWPPDLLYERMSLFSALGAQLRTALGVPWVLELNAPLSWEACWFEGEKPRSGLVRCEERALRAADAVVVVSEPLRDYAVRRGAPRERVWLVPNGARPTVVAVPRRPEEGVFVLGYEGTFKVWQGMLGQVDDLRRLVEESGGRRVRLELWGDGPDRRPLTDALAGLPGIDVDYRGWGVPQRSSWSAAWVPSGPWPPESSAIEKAFGEAPPERYFSSLKGAAAAAASVPTWNRGRLIPARSQRPQTWREVADTISQLVGSLRASPRP